MWFVQDDPAHVRPSSVQVHAPSILTHLLQALVMGEHHSALPPTEPDLCCYSSTLSSTWAVFTWTSYTWVFLPHLWYSQSWLTHWESWSHLEVKCAEGGTKLRRFKPKLYSLLAVRPSHMTKDKPSLCFDFLICEMMTITDRLPPRLLNYKCFTQVKHLEECPSQSKPTYICYYFYSSSSSSLPLPSHPLCLLFCSVSSFLCSLVHLLCPQYLQPILEGLDSDALR